MTPAQVKYRFDALFTLGCIVCLNSGAGKVTPHIHHLTGIKYRSTGKKANDLHTIPLCYEHHQGREGIHTIGMRPWETQHGTQATLLNQVNELIGAKDD